jgi:Dolichyl-phosphate-mannose-protein mannosyltransferase
MSPWRAIPLALLLAVVVRVPFWIEALHTPVDGDTAIVGLMARHPGEGTTLWGQPYGSPLDAWVAMPFVAIWGTSVEALRLPSFLLSLGFVVVAFAVARELHPAAGLPAAVLAACPPPYFLLLSALPPPFYPTTLLLCGLILVCAARAGRRLADPDGPAPRGTLFLLGLFSGLALWTHLMSASAVAASGLWLVLRSRGRRRLLAWALVPLAAASAPLWTRALRDHEAMRIVQVESRSETTLSHLQATLPRLHEPLGGVLGTHVPVVADAEDFVLYHPGWAAALTVLLYGTLLVLAGRAARGGHPAALLFLAAGLALAAFPFPVRSAPHTIRLLTPLFLPVAALVAWAASAGGGTTRRAWVLVLGLASLHLLLGTRLLETWRRTDRADPPFVLVDLAPVRKLLEGSGVRHAYASYGPAFRLTWESGERIVASPPWNDRFRHWPLPLLDEVRFAKNVAWVLTPSVPSGLPPASELEQALERIGGRWRRDEAGAAVVFHAFVPPYAPAVEPWPGAGAAGDSDLRTFVAPAAGAPLELRLETPRALAAITLTAALDGPRLPRSADVQVSADGRTFETVARRRRREERQDLRWLNGHPQAVIDHDVIAVPLGGREVVALRVIALEPEPWRVGEVLLHAEPGRQAWDEWLPPGADWEARRRALVERPLPDREDWYSRVLLAARHRPPP